MSGRANLRRVIRIVLVEVPNLMTAVLNDAIAKDRTMAIIANFDSAMQAAEAFKEGTFDVVVTALKAGQRDVPLPLQRLLFQFPHASVIAFSGGGHRMEVFDHNVVREIAPDQIPRLIREMKRSADEDGI